METRIIKIVKGIGMILTFSLITFAVNGQDAWRTTKDVQRYASKNVFTSEDLKNSHIEANSEGYPIWVTKKVHQPEESQERGNIISKGYPMWTTKGIHRMKAQPKMSDDDQLIDPMTPKDESFSSNN